MVLVFVVQTLIAMFSRSTVALGFWAWAAAGETAAWRLKWISIPVLFVTLWFGRKLYRSILLQPKKFCGIKYARSGLLASSIVTLLVALLIGITVPARLRQRKMSHDAAILAQWYTVERALLEYKIKYKTYPADLRDLLERVPDPDGTLTAALINLDPNGYRPRSADVAAVASEKSRTLRGALISKTSLSSAPDDTQPVGLTVTGYVLRLPGEDKIMGNEDDWVGTDGMIMRLSDIAKGGVGRSVSAGALKP